MHMYVERCSSLWPGFADEFAVFLAFGIQGFDHDLFA